MHACLDTPMKSSLSQSNKLAIPFNQPVKRTSLSHSLSLARFLLLCLSVYLSVSLPHTNVCLCFCLYFCISSSMSGDACLPLCLSVSPLPPSQSLSPSLHAPSPFCFSRHGPALTSRYRFRRFHIFFVCLSVCLSPPPSQPLPPSMILSLLFLTTRTCPYL